MVMARAIERRVWLLHRTGHAEASLHAGGSEAVQVAAAAVLRPGVDWVVPRPLDLALCLAMGLSPLDVLLAVFGRAADPASAGRAEPGSFSSRSARIVSTSAGAGAHAIHAAGIAYASKLRGLDEVTLLSTDARGAGSGDWHEGVNFAAVHRLPVVCIVIDANDGAIAPLAQPEADSFVRKSYGYGLAGAVVDGGDFDAAFASLNQAAERARSGQGPTVVHAPVRPLSALNASGVLQAPEQLEAGSRQDPIGLMRQKLLGLRLLDDETELRIQADCLSVVSQEVERARASASPRPAAALENVVYRTDA